MNKKCEIGKSPVSHFFVPLHSESTKFFDRNEQESDITLQLFNIVYLHSLSLLYQYELGKLIVM